MSNIDSEYLDGNLRVYKCGKVRILTNNGDVPLISSLTNGRTYTLGALPDDSIPYANFRCMFPVMTNEHNFQIAINTSGNINIIPRNGTMSEGEYICFELAYLTS